VSDTSPTDPGRAQPPLEEMVPARRTSAPRYPIFIGAGVVLGVLAAAVATFYASSTNDDYSLRSIFGYTALLLGLVGGLLGGAVAVLLDRRT